MGTENCHQAITVCIGLGSNLGNSLQILWDAWQRLGQINGIRLQALSSPYRTEPFGMESEHWFVNAAGLLTTSFSPDDLLDLLLEVEQKFGRRRNLGTPNGYQDRTLDLDLLLYDNLIVKTSRLQIPHPDMHRRLFVLVPLAELVPQQLHPGLHRSIDSLRRQLMDENDTSPPERIRWPLVVE